MSTTIASIYKAQTDYFETGAARPYAFRIAQLKKLKKAIKKHEKAIEEALFSDLHKHPFEAYSSEIGFLYDEINDAITHLSSWMEEETPSTPMVHFPSSSKVYKDPLGLVLIIGPWNYPFQLTIAPLIGSICGGNCTIIKPSNQTKHTAQIIEQLIAETFEPNYVAVIQGGGAAIVPEILNHYRFDHIFFTGSANVGKQIMAAAAQHLTPVTLELGGKSPCIVAEDAKIDTAAKRIIWGKFWNAGQTCVGVDYLLVHEKVKDKLVEKLKKYIIQFFGEDASQSDSYSKIVNEKRFDILQSYLSQGTIVYGGQTKKEQLYIQPTILDNVSMNSQVMQEEIFGPILPIITFKDNSEAIKIIKNNPYPLALYLFTESTKTEKQFIENVRFGGGCINNILVHLVNPEIPFGGVGYSGMGNYHGKYSFETFTHRKSILSTSSLIDVPIKYAPFNNKKKFLKLFMN